MTDVVIVGAGCAGLTAALYIARAGKTVTVLEKQSIGGQIASSPRVENYPGISEITGASFSDALCAQAENFGATLDCTHATGIERTAEGFIVHTEDDALPCRGVILATGARPKKLGLPNEDKLRGVSYCAVCDGAFYKDRNVAVVGGGSAALQSAEYLSRICKSVTLIHRRDAFRGEDALVKRVAAYKNVSLCLNARVVKLLGEDALTGVELTVNGQSKTFFIDGLFVCVGREPENAQFSPLVALDAAGYIAAGETCATSCPGIFAAGDCRVKDVRQLTTAAADGTIAALGVLGWIEQPR